MAPRNGQLWTQPSQHASGREQARVHPQMPPEWLLCRARRPRPALNHRPAECPVTWCAGPGTCTWAPTNAALKKSEAACGLPRRRERRSRKRARAGNGRSWACRRCWRDGSQRRQRVAAASSRPARPSFVVPPFNIQWNTTRFLLFVRLTYLPAVINNHLAYALYAPLEKNRN